MAQIKFPYGKEKMEYTFDDKELKAVLTSAIEEYEPGKTPEELVRSALRNPVGGVKLSELAKGRKNIVIIASDHTRPVPSKVIIPPMLEVIRSGLNMVLTTLDIKVNTDYPTYVITGVIVVVAIMMDIIKTNNQNKVKIEKVKETKTAEETKA